jgi:hypothetical protein
MEFSKQPFYKGFFFEQNGQFCELTGLFAGEPAKNPYNAPMLSWNMITLGTPPQLI